MTEVPVAPEELREALEDVLAGRRRLTRSGLRMPSGVRVKLPDGVDVKRLAHVLRNSDEARAAAVRQGRQADDEVLAPAAWVDALQVADEFQGGELTREVRRAAVLLAGLSPEEVWFTRAALVAGEWEGGGAPGWEMSRNQALRLLTWARTVAEPLVDQPPVKSRRKPAPVGVERSDRHRGTLRAESPSAGRTPRSGLPVQALGVLDYVLRDDDVVVAHLEGNAAPDLLEMMFNEFPGVPVKLSAAVAATEAPGAGRADGGGAAHAEDETAPRRVRTVALPADVAPTAVGDGVIERAQERLQRAALTGGDVAAAAERLRAAVAAGARAPAEAPDAVVDATLEDAAEVAEAAEAVDVAHRAIVAALRMGWPYEVLRGHQPELWDRLLRRVRALVRRRNPGLGRAALARRAEARMDELSASAREHELVVADLDAELRALAEALRERWQAAPGSTTLAALVASDDEAALMYAKALDVACRRLLREWGDPRRQKQDAARAMVEKAVGA